MLRLTIDARMIQSSGIGTYLRNVLSFLVREPSVRITLLIDPNHPPDAGNDTACIRFSARIYGWKEQVMFPLVVPRCDLLWSPHFNAPVGPVRARRRVVTVHDLFHLDCPQYVPFAHRFYAKFLLNSAVRKAQAVITVSNFSKNRLVELLNVESEKVHVIYNSVDHDRFVRITDRDRLARTRRDLNLPERFLLFVGNVKPHKNILGLLEAWSRIEKRFGDHALVVVGKRENFITGVRNLESEIARLNLANRVHFTGVLADDKLPEVYNLAAGLILASFYEGFGLPVLEAMACGCPVIASQTASLPEICGDAAQYVNPADADSIADGIERVLGNERTRSELTQKGFQQAKQFSWDLSFQKHMRIFQTVLESHE